MLNCFKRFFLSGRYGNKSFVCSLTLFLLTFTVYLPALQNGFVSWDDNIYVYENQNIRSMGLDFIRWSFSDASVGHWLPVTWFSFALDYAFWGLNPLGFHLTNIILHSLNTILVFILAMRLIEEGSRGQGVVGSDYSIGRPAGSPLRTANYERRAVVAAFVTALLFGIHPLHVESVAWVTERKDVLSLLFFLMTILSYLKYNSSVGSEKRVYYCVTLILFIIALMAKPMVITLPVILLILDFYPMQRLVKGKEARWILIEKIPFFLLSILSSLITIWAAGSAGALGTLESHPLAIRLFVAIRALVGYLIKIIMPFNLAPFYPYPKRVVIFTFDYMGPLVVLSIITAGCIYSLKRTRLFMAAWMYYIVSLIPVLGVVAAGGQAAADRYTYLPSLAPFFLAGLWIESIVAGWRRDDRKLSTIAIIAIMVLVSSILVNKTIKQIAIWKDSLTLWSYEIKLFPYGTPVAYNNRGIVYANSGDYLGAISDYNVSISMDAKNLEAYFNRGCSYNSLGRYDQAIKDFDRAIELTPKDGYAYGNRGIAYYGLGDYERAIKDYTRAIELNPQDKSAYGNRGNAYYGLGDYEKAIKDYNRAIEIAPQNAVLYYNLGLAYSRSGDSKRALTNFKKGADLGSRDAKECLGKRGK